MSPIVPFSLISPFCLAIVLSFKKFNNPADEVQPLKPVVITRQNLAINPRKPSAGAGFGGFGRKGKLLQKEDACAGSAGKCRKGKAGFHVLSLELWLNIRERSLQGGVIGFQLVRVELGPAQW
jgi:hypothetical protein